MLALRHLFLSDEGPTLETLDFTIHIGSTVHQPFYISICISKKRQKQTKILYFLKINLFAEFVNFNKKINIDFEFVLLF